MACWCSATCTSIPRRRCGSAARSARSTPRPATTRSRGSTGSASTPRRTPRPSYLRATFDWHIDGCTPEDDAVSAEGDRAVRPSGRRRGGETEFASPMRLSTTSTSRSEAGWPVCGCCTPWRRRSGWSLPTRAPSSWPRGGDDPRRSIRSCGPTPPAAARWCSGASTDHVVGMDAAASRALLDDLLRRCTAPERVYRHEWSVGDTVIWDNRGVIHRAAPYDRRTRRERCCAPPSSATSRSDNPAFSRRKYHHGPLAQARRGQLDRALSRARHRAGVLRGLDLAGVLRARARGDLQAGLARTSAGSSSCRAPAATSPRRSHVAAHVDHRGARHGRRGPRLPQHLPPPRQQAGVERLPATRRPRAPAASSPASTTAGATTSTARSTFVQQEGEFFDLDKADYGLVPVHCDVWAGFIFVNLDRRARADRCASSSARWSPRSRATRSTG